MVAVLADGRIRVVVTKGDEDVVADVAPEACDDDADDAEGNGGGRDDDDIDRRLSASEKSSEGIVAAARPRRCTRAYPRRSAARHRE